MDSQIVLKAKDIYKKYATFGKDLEVLKGINLEVPQGNMAAVIGASGVGKSTLLHILGGLDRPDKGSVELDQTDIFRLNDSELCRFRNAQMGFVFQFHHLLSEFNALENVMIPQLIGGESKTKSKEKAYTILEEVGLADRHQHRPAELSGGEQQRLAVARALANDPQVVIADEPTGNLDHKSSQDLTELFCKLVREKHLTFILATHNLELARKADQIYELKQGQAVLVEQKE